jgi:hypothetical protein
LFLFICYQPALSSRQAVAGAKKLKNFGKEKLKILSIKLYFLEIAKPQQLFQFGGRTFPFCRD